MLTSPKEVLAAWPSQEELAADIDASLAAIRKWAQRGSIPSEYWLALVTSARGRSIRGVTFAALAAMHARTAPVRRQSAEARA